ncbi:peroxisomal protein 2 [Monosporozyma unispora]|nr:hypothetical protein C6P44_003691 [Kazachstania unispora]
MGSIINEQRLLQLYQFHPKLRNAWYLIAAATLSVANQPQEIPKVYHYAMQLSARNADKYHVTLAHKTMQLLSDVDPEQQKQTLEREYKFPSVRQNLVSEKMREALLKTGPLAGLPRAINGLHTLKEFTPSKLLPKASNIDAWEATMGDEIPCPESYRKVVECKEDQLEVVHRGLRQWNTIYNKVSNRVVNNLHSSYPDLWYYTLIHCYGPLFSFDKILSVPETSMVVISALVPQDVNPQLKGHLRGALNVGCDFETIEAVRTLSILVSEWCGIKWVDGVVKLKPKKMLTNHKRY